MALVNQGSTPFLGHKECIPRPLSWTRDSQNFDDTDYWYAEFFNHDSINFLYDSSILPADISQKIQRKECKIVLNNAHEAFHSVVEAIYKFIQDFNIDPSQVILLSESAIINQEVEKVAATFNLGTIKTKWVRVFEHSTHNTPHDVFTTLEDKQYDKKFISFNRRWRLHRPMLVALLEIHDLLDKGYVSLAKADDNKDWNTFFEEIDWALKPHPVFKSMFTDNIERIKNIPELKLDQEDMTVNHAHVLTDSTDSYYKNTYFSVVTETTFFQSYGEGVFVSEKIFRPVFKKHPFLLLSRPNTLKAFREIGYKTFSNIINEDYDSEPNDCKRMNMIVGEINRLCNLNPTELQSFLIEARSIVEHNYQVLMNKTNFISDL